MLVEVSKSYPSVSITDDGLLWSGPRMKCRIVRCVFGCQANHVRWRLLCSIPIVSDDMLMLLLEIRSVQRSLCF